MVRLKGHARREAKEQQATQERERERRSPRESGTESASHDSPIDENLSIEENISRAFSNIAPRPTPSHKLGVHFPPNSKLPKFVWVQFNPTIKEATQFSVPQVERFLTYGPRDSFTAEQLLIEKTRIPRAREVDYTLAVYMRDNFGNDGSKPTQSAKALIGKKPTHDWCGPLLVVAMEGNGTPQTMDLVVGGMTLSVPAGHLFPRARDVVLGDLKIVGDYFMKYPYDLPEGFTLTDGEGNSVDRVVLNGN